MLVVESARSCTGSIVVEDGGVPSPDAASPPATSDHDTTHDATTHDATTHDATTHDATTYGEAFADVYDEWYHDITDTDATVAALHRLAIPGLPVLELGVGTGRVAIPLAALGHEVHGVDTSSAMLSKLAANDPGGTVHTLLADMVTGLPDEQFGLVFIAYNTLFNIYTAEGQQQCFVEVTRRLAPGAVFVVEAFVPASSIASESGSSESVTVRSVTADRVVLSVSVSDAASQTARGQYIDITEAGGVKLRPWSIRYAAPDELDDMAERAGLQLTDRFESFDKAPFTSDSPRHVSVYLTRHSPNSSLRPRPGRNDPIG